MTAKKKEPEETRRQEDPLSNTGKMKAKGQAEKAAAGQARPEVGEEKDSIRKVGVASQARPRQDGPEEQARALAKKDQSQWQAEDQVRSQDKEDQVMAEQPPEARPPEEGEEAKKQADQRFPVVGIGASAGGLEPLELFFSSLPRPLPEDLAFVIIQHLGPQHRSIIGEILKKDTDLPVREIEDNMQVEPHTIYFNPPDKEVGLYQGVFQLMEPSQGRHTRMPIDYFFRSLAQDLENKAICIVLSGTGSDGTLGLEAVKGGGGMTMAQAEDQAKYPFMPRSAIDTGLVDYIVPVERMPEELLLYVKHPYLEGCERVPADKHYQTYLQKILMLVRANTKHDFSHYKQTTIRRRLGRRLAVHKFEDIADYFHYLRENPAEIHNLFKDLIICVTSFFRDFEAFQILEAKVIPDILSAKSPDQSIRVWVPGCGTGEEPLSIAILLDEFMERTGRRHCVQIFATDIDKQGIDIARMGEYPESIGADMTPGRLKKYFSKRNGFYRINQEIREMVVYAAQNLISDPPFSHLDLISCRNVLIYLDTDAQKQIMAMFHFTLNPNGYLFLGSSETIGGAADLFTTIDVRWKIFQCKSSSQQRLTEYPTMKMPATYDRMRRRAELPSPVSVRTLTEKIILGEYTPPAVVFNSRYDIIYLLGDTVKYLGMPKGEPSYNLFNLINEDLRPKLLTLLHRAVAEKKLILAKSIPYRYAEGEAGYLNVSVRPLEAPDAANLFLAVFEEVNPPPPPKKIKGKNKLTPEEDSQVAILEHELLATREYLQTTVEELEASNEELKSTNEELQSTNEELQSTNEELETAKEELQSTNEELVTVNAELNNKIYELIEVNNDINNLLASTEIGTLFLDRELRIRRFTPAATHLFNLIPTDVGRSIKDIAPKTENPNIWEDTETVLHTLQVKDMELKSLTGEIYAGRILPYRTRENLIDGVVITFIDVSAQHLLGLAKTFAESIADTVRESLLILNSDLRVISANQTFYATFKANKANTENRRLYELGDGQWDIPKLRELLEEIIPRNAEFRDFRVEHNFPGIGLKIMLLNARRIPAVGEHASLILLAIEDMTEVQKKEWEYQETITRLEKELGEARGRGQGKA